MAPLSLIEQPCHLLRQPAPAQARSSYGAASAPARLVTWCSSVRSVGRSGAVGSGTLQNVASAIYYDVAGFPSRLPNGLACPASGPHATTMARLIWAATTVGTTPFGPRLRHSRALEVQWRTSMVRASLRRARGCFWRSESYARLDPSEKGAVSFFLGQAQAKLFAHDFFRVSRLVHYDSYLVYLGRPRRRTRPDFVGFYGRRVAIGLEAKGRSPGRINPRAVVTQAKKQASSLPAIHGHPLTATYVHMAYFDGDRWRAHLEDPPRPRQEDGVDPAPLTLSYYLPLVDAIRTRETETVSLDDEFPYLRAYFAEIDAHLSVRADIATLVPPLTADGSFEADVFRSAGNSLYDVSLTLDEVGAQVQRPGPLDTERAFLGGDGVAVELGSTWTEGAGDTD